MKDVESSSKQVLDELENKHQVNLFINMCDFLTKCSGLHHVSQNEMKELSERMDVEKQQWIENYMKKQVCTGLLCEQMYPMLSSNVIDVHQDAVLLQKERELKESVRESRDKVRRL